MVKAWDRIVVINCDHRADRMTRFNESIKNSKLLVDVQRFSACTPSRLAWPTWFQDHLKGTGREAAYWCCRESHLMVWSQAILDGVQHLLVVEDDVAIVADFDQQVEAFFGELPDDWYGYQLGGYKWSGATRLTDNCGRMNGCGGLMAYGLNARGLQRTYDHVLWHRELYLDHATQLLHKVEPHYYCPRKFMAGQDAGYSDNYLGHCSAQGFDQLW